jgi:hypothetical protein
MADDEGMGMLEKRADREEMKYPAKKRSTPANGEDHGYSFSLPPLQPSRYSCET